jgi:hypothetical protein
MSSTPRSTFSGHAADGVTAAHPGAAAPAESRRGWPTARGPLHCVLALRASRAPSRRPRPSRAVSRLNSPLVRMTAPSGSVAVDLLANRQPPASHLRRQIVKVGVVWDIKHHRHDVASPTNDRRAKLYRAARSPSRLFRRGCGSASSIALRTFSGFGGAWSLACASARTGQASAAVRPRASEKTLRRARGPHPFRVGKCACLAPLLSALHGASSSEQ